MYFFFLFYFHSQAGLQIQAIAFDCDEKVNEKIKAISDYIKDSYRTQDVIEHVDKLENTIKSCNINSARYGWGDGIYSFWRQPSLEKKIQIKEENLRKRSLYLNVDKEVEEYKHFLLKYGQLTNQRQENLEAFIRQGRQSREREKSKCSHSPQIDPKRFGPIRDQDGIGWCYAFAAADLISYKTGKIVSAADIAHSYTDNMVSRSLKKYLNITEKDLEGGNVNNAILNMKFKGSVCIESEFSSEDNGAWGQDLLSILETIDKNPNNCANPLLKLFPSLLASDVAEILKTATHGSTISESKKIACKNKVDTKELETFVSYFNEDPIGGFDLMDRALSRGKPVSISYLGSILKDKNDLDEKTYHASTIIDRRFNDNSGQCEYLIRNSHGRSCGGYDKSYECQEGSIWIPKETLMKATRGYTYVD